jgi:hypothetical protein
VRQSRGRAIATTAVAAAGLVLSAVGGTVAEAPTLWGILPIALYAVLCLLGMDLVVATVVSLIGGVSSRVARPWSSPPCSATRWAT